MSVEHLLAGLPGTVLLLVILVGLVVRGRLASCWSFGLYLATLLVTTSVMLVLPDRFYTYVFFSQKDTVLHVLKLFIALEIGLRTYSVFPRARLRAGLLFTGVLLATAFAVWSVPEADTGYRTLLGTLAPVQQAGALWALATVAGTTQWYRIPLDPLHRAILTSFAIYLAVVTLITTLIAWGDLPGPVMRILGFAYQASSFVVEAFWAWHAWRPVRLPNPAFATIPTVATLVVDRLPRP